MCRCFFIFCLIWLFFFFPVNAFLPGLSNVFISLRLCKLIEQQQQQNKQIRIITLHNICIQKIVFCLHPIELIEFGLVWVHFVPCLFSFFLNRIIWFFFIYHSLWLFEMMNNFPTYLLSAIDCLFLPMLYLFSTQIMFTKLKYDHLQLLQSSHTFLMSTSFECKIENTHLNTHTHIDPPLSHSTHTQTHMYIIENTRGKIKKIHWIQIPLGKIPNSQH